MTEVWFRNAEAYAGIAVELSLQRFAWLRSSLERSHFEPIPFLKVHFSGLPWRAVVLDDVEFGETEWFEPQPHEYKRFPTFQYGVGTDGELVRMVERQRYDGRVYVMGCHAADERGRAFLKFVSALQEQHPGCTIHVNGPTTFAWKFGLPFGAVDFAPGIDAGKNRKIHLPNGDRVCIDDIKPGDQWLRLLDFHKSGLKTRDGRIHYNIESARWAAVNFRRDVRFRRRRPAGRTSRLTGNGGTYLEDVDITTPSSLYRPPALKSNHLSTKKPGDKFLCSLCSLRNECQLYRQDGVCIVPGAETQQLAKMFKSRNADHIIDGLATLLASQTDRLQKGMEAEAMMPELDPEVTKLANAIFGMGVKLAKLRAPELNGSAVRVGISLQAGHAGGAGSIERGGAKIVAQVVRELEASGIPRDQITSEMVQAALSPPEVIDAEVVE